MRAIFLHGSGRNGCAPGRGSVIGTARHQHFLTTAVGACRQQRHAGSIRAILAEHRPVSMRHHTGECFGKLDHARRRTGRHVDFRHLPHIGSINFAMAVAK